MLLLWTKLGTRETVPPRVCPVLKEGGTAWQLAGVSGCLADMQG